MHDDCSHLDKLLAEHANTVYSLLHHLSWRWLLAKNYADLEIFDYFLQFSRSIIFWLIQIQLKQASNDLSLSSNGLDLDLPSSSIVSINPILN